MGREESNNYTSREMLRMALNAIEEHKRESASFREATSIQLSKLNQSVIKIETHATYSKDSIDKHEEKINSLEKSRTWFKGVGAAIAAVIAFLGWLISEIKNN